MADRTKLRADLDHLYRLAVETVEARRFRCRELAEEEAVRELRFLTDAARLRLLKALGCAEDDDGPPRLVDRGSR